MRRSSDISLRLACCWTIERRREDNEEKGEHTLVMTP